MKVMNALPKHIIKIFIQVACQNDLGYYDNM
jgi:hypothetical protein